MKLNPALSGFDRIVNFVGGIGLLAYASVGDFDHEWVRVTFAVLGIVFTAGSIGGT